MIRKGMRVRVKNLTSYGVNHMKTWSHSREAVLTGSFEVQTANDMHGVTLVGVLSNGNPYAFCYDYIIPVRDTFRAQMPSDSEEPVFGEVYE